MNMWPKRSKREQPEPDASNGSLHITVDQLEDYFKAICGHVRENYDNDLKIDMGYYWDICPGDMNPDQEFKTPEPGLGDLAFDIERLDAMLKNSQDPAFNEDAKGFTVMKDDFRYLAAVLRAISEEYIPFIETPEGDPSQ